MAEREPDPTVPPPAAGSVPSPDGAAGSAAAPPPVAPPVALPSDAALERVDPVAAVRAGIPDGSDSDLWVFSFDGLERAQEAMLAVSRLTRRRHLELEDAAIVTLRRGRVRLLQTRDMNPAQGAVGGAWLGTIAGLFAGLPLVGAALGAAAGGMYARLRDFGIDDGEMKAFGRTLEGERAALFLLVRDCHRMRALHEVSRFPARLERSSADADLVAEVRARLAVDPWDG
jgi:uncharacterized membrane protein